MFELTVRTHFDAAHRLRKYKGKCAQIHGHTWHVEVLVQGRTLDETGMLIDFAVLKGLVKEEVGRLDHTFLNELADFSGEEGLNPTAENLAAHLFAVIKKKLAQINEALHLYEVKVWESPNACAAYREG